MKKALSILACVGIAMLLHPAAASAMSVDSSGGATVCVKVDGDKTIGGKTACIKAFVGKDMAACGKQIMVVRNEEAEGDGSESTERKFVVHVKQIGGMDVDPDSGWLGVHISQVSKALLDDPNIDEHSQLIEKVIDDSAAAQAGLEKGDIIVGLDGKRFEGALSESVNRIREIGAGNPVTLDIVRDGVPMSLPATLGSPPKEHNFWVQQLGDGACITDSVRMGNLLKLDDDGKFITMQLGLDLVDLGTETELRINEGKLTIRLVSTSDDTTTVIEQADDGPITVLRTVGDQDPVEVEYANAEELEAGDEEAFKLYNQSRPGAGVRVLDLRDLYGGSKLDLGQLHADNILIEIQESVREAQQAAKDAEEYMRSVTLDISSLDDLKSLDISGLTALHLNRVTKSVRVNPDGQIEVTLRKGDTEVVKVYSDEADLQARDAETYEKYADILDAPTDD